MSDRINQMGMSASTGNARRPTSDKDDRAGLAPDPALISSMHGKSLSEIYNTYILNGQPLETLRCSDEHYRLAFDWPVDLAVDGTSFPVLKHDGSGGFGVFPTEADNVREIQRRFQSLLELLRSGVCIGFGHDANMERREIPGFLWCRLGIHIDFYRSDLVERDRGQATRALFRSIELQARGDFHAGAGRKPEKLFDLIYREVEQLEDIEGYFRPRGARAEFARRLHELNPHYKLSAIRRELQEVLKARHPRTE